MKPMPLDAVFEQLRVIREHLGPGGNVQLTSGEVTLLPANELAQVVAKSRELDLSPMLMTHGQNLLDDPSYLKHLTDAGLTKVCFHVDTHQRGRRGIPRPQNEGQLLYVRNAIAELLTTHHKENGRRIKAASSLTITAENAPELPEIIDWFLDKAPAFRLLSLQPVAEVGRTKHRGSSADDVWTQVNRYFDRNIDPHAFWFGHKACSKIAVFMVVKTTRERFEWEAVRSGFPMDRAFFDRAIETFRGVVINDQPFPIAASRIVGAMIRRPLFLLHAVIYGIRRLWQQKKLVRKILASSWSKPFQTRAFPFAIVVHDFMSADQIETPLGQERVSACAFKVPYKGEMVSMCAFNAMGHRQASYDESRSISDRASCSEATV